jgi:uncharacterized protein (DUF736 family)
MENIKSFVIFKNNNKEKETHPDYRISIKIGEEYVDGGGVWLKEGKNGKFFSCKLNDAKNGRKGFSIKVEEDVPDNASQIPF